MPDVTKYWQVSAEAGSAPGKVRVTLLLYGDITMYPNDWYAEDRSPYEIAQEIKATAGEDEVEHITVRINSPGGSAFGGLAIANILRQWPAPVTTLVDGLAGSAASIIFMAGDERVMPSNALLFIHRASTFAWGNAGDMEKMAADLKTIDEAIFGTYQEHVTLSEKRLRELFEAESFISAADAKKWGFATKIDRVPVAASLRGPQLVVNGLSFDPARYKMKTAEIMEALGAKVEEEPAATETPEADALQHEDTKAQGHEGEEGDVTPADAADPPIEEEEEEVDDFSPAEAEMALERAGLEGAARIAALQAELEEDAVDAAAEERARIRAIDDLAARCPGCEALATLAKYGDDDTAPLTPEAFAMRLIQDGFAARARGLADRAADAAEASNLAKPGQAPTSESAAQAEIDARVADAERYLRR